MDLVINASVVSITSGKSQNISDSQNKWPLTLILIKRKLGNRIPEETPKEHDSCFKR